MSIDVANESGVEVDEGALVTLARHVLDSMRVHPLAELSLLLVDTDAMSELHEQWMNEPGPTDVLAFPMDELRPGREAAATGAAGAAGGSGASDSDDEPGLLGDVVLCPRVAADQAAAAGHAAEEELHLLCTHGVLHLLGYDHEEPEERQEMFGLQSELLSSWRAERSSDGGSAGFDRRASR